MLHHEASLSSFTIHTGEYGGKYWWEAMNCKNNGGKKRYLDVIVNIINTDTVLIEVSRVDLTDLPPRGDHHVTIAN